MVRVLVCGESAPLAVTHCAPEVLVFWEVQKSIAGFFRDHGRLGPYLLSVLWQLQFSTRTRSHHPRRDIAQKRNSRESADKPRDVQGRLLLRPERRRNHALLELRLKGLNNPHGPFALALNGAKLVGRDARPSSRGLVSRFAATTAS
jgi:hypothetical protein